MIIKKFFENHRITMSRKVLSLPKTGTPFSPQINEETLNDQYFPSLSVEINNKTTLLSFPMPVSYNKKTK